MLLNKLIFLVIYFLISVSSASILFIVFLSIILLLVSNLGFSFFVHFEFSIILTFFVVLIIFLFSFFLFLLLINLLLGNLLLSIFFLYTFLRIASNFFLMNFIGVIFIITTIAISHISPKLR